MKLALSLLLCLALSVLVCGEVLAYGKTTLDPNVGGSSVSRASASIDARLAQKVSYEVRYAPVQRILKDLTDMTGIELRAGSSSSDWPVRSRKMNIFVKDVSMSSLMNSIAHVMKFRWTRNDDVDPPTYRLVVDRKAAAQADEMMKLADKKKESTKRQWRNEWIDAIMQYGSIPGSQLQSLRETNPVIYRYARYGALEALKALFEEVPEAKGRFAAGRSFRVASSRLSSRTKELIYSAGDYYWKYLQMSGQLGKVPEEPHGYADWSHLIKPDSNFDIAFVRMDETGGFSPGFRWGGISRSSGYFHLRNGKGNDMEMADLRAINEDLSKLACGGNNRVLDKYSSFLDSYDTTVGPQKSEEHDVEYYKTMYAKISQDLKREEESLYPSEPVTEHTAFAELDKKIKLTIDPPKPDENKAMAANNYIASLQKAVFEETGLGVVSDSWVNIQGDKLPDHELKLADILDKFSENFNYNWDKSSSILEFRHRKWAKMRLNQIPDEWVTEWREDTRKTTLVSLSEFAKISTLNYYQVEESLKGDEVLGSPGAYKDILKMLEDNFVWLRLYWSLSPQLKNLLMSERGINGQMLTSAQWSLAQTMFDRIGSPRWDAIFRLELLPNGVSYQFREFNNDTGEEDRRWILDLGRYTPPVSKVDAVVKPPKSEP